MSTQQTHPVMTQWFKAIEERNVEKAVSLLAPDIQVAPPFMKEGVEGPAETLSVFMAVEEVTEIWKYGRQWVNGNEIALEFFTRIEGEDIHGIDIININDNGQITRFDICARPQSSVQKMGEAVKNHLKTVAK